MTTTESAMGHVESDNLDKCINKETDKMTTASSICFTSLPDELISMCYTGLPANDLIVLEHVSSRLRSLISTDGICWRECVKAKWDKSRCNTTLLQRAARHAGSWKLLYAEKSKTSKNNSPWFVACNSEINSMIDIILSLDSSSTYDTKFNFTNATGTTEVKSQKSIDIEPSSPPRILTSCVTTSSPISVISSNNNDNNVPLTTVSVIVLIDASSSVTDDDFKSMKKFTHLLIKGLRNNITKEAFISILQFNQHPRIELPLTAVSKPKVTATVDDMGQLMGSTDIAAPIRKAREIFNEANASVGGLADLDSSSNADAQRIIVLITDGQTHSDELRESERQAHKAYEDMGATIYTIGVGRDIDERGLTRIAAATNNGMYFTLRRHVHSR